MGVERDPAIPSEVALVVAKGLESSYAVVVDDDELGDQRAVVDQAVVNPQVPAGRLVAAAAN